LLLVLVRLPRGDQPHDRLTLSEATANNQNAGLETQAEQDESVFIIGVVRVKEPDRVLIVKDGARFFERYTVLLDIGLVLPAVPLEMPTPTYIQRTFKSRVVNSCKNLIRIMDLCEVSLDAKQRSVESLNDTAIAFPTIPDDSTNGDATVAPAQIVRNRGGNDMMLEELGNRIRDARVSLGMTQTDVAGALQVSPQAVSKWERGENAPDIVLLPELARLLDVTTDRLLGTYAPSERTIEATVCMSDIAGFAKQVERLTPEDVGTLMNAHFLQLTEVVLKYGGIPVKYIGDAFLFFFAGPEHRPRAIRAALHMKRVSTVELSIGMSTGPIFFGKIGHPDYARMDIMGDTVNLAVRTESWAGKTQSRVAASAETVEGIGKEFEYGSIEEVEVKGRTGATTLYEIREERSEFR
jgi:class 3 adenylate cyclase